MQELKRHYRIELERIEEFVVRASTKMAKDRLISFFLASKFKPANIIFTCFLFFCLIKESQDYGRH